jgi:spore protease
MNLYSDLAFEKISGDYKTTKLGYGIEELTIKIDTKKDILKYNKPKGDYYSLNCSNLIYYGIDCYKFIIEKLSNCLNEFINKLNLKLPKILVVGLGNINIVSDSLGSKVANKIITNSKNKKFCEVYSFISGVKGKTGINTSDSIKAICKEIKPNLVIIVDSLCAIHTSRLGKSFQISNTGIVPAGAINNDSNIIDNKFLQVPVFSIGVPLVIKANTFIGEILDSITDNLLDCDSENISDDLKDMVITMNDIDNYVNIDSFILSTAINMSLQNLTYDEVIKFYY